jgi:hypothetical protein
MPSWPKVLPEPYQRIANTRAAALAAVPILLRAVDPQEGSHCESTILQGKGPPRSLCPPESLRLCSVLSPWTNKDTPGQFGDMFGVINALFTGLALAGAIYTILLQRHELELQREELRLTREQLHASAESIKPRLGGFRHRYLPRQDLRSWDMVSARPLRHRVATGPE